MLLGVVEEKVYYRYKGEHGQRYGHQGESGVDMARELDRVMREMGEKKRGHADQETDLAQEIWRVKGRRKAQVTKMAGLYTERHLAEGQPDSWAGEI